ncbi:glycoside hydrolase family 26 protein [Streptomyces sp. NBC_00878]|uniref:glycoside hydrolase family 26 protein n=1 Tax=Streptomyces sp. NBC_00878 TaxID=2975854 RepID=UPI0022546F08|nr:glycosyl hydrolase [Streptomyces sp. NBC_00878]MCX4908593.1 glycosyl hydrolase [Streptomyces sp. NBC_00878]
MVLQQCRARTRRLAVVVAAVAVSAALASGTGFAAGTGPLAGPSAPMAATPAPTVPAAAASAASAAPPAPQASAVTPDLTTRPVIEPSKPAPPNSSAVASTTSAPGTERPAFGAFLGSGVRGVYSMPGLSGWLGGAELRVGHTYLPGDRWSNIEGTDTFLAPWARWRTAKDDRIFVLNVPMQERNEEGVSDAEVRLLLRQGAAGQFDHHFRALAARLVALNVPDTVLVLGWEMNGTTYTHRCGPDPTAWKSYWNRIVTTMRSVPGQKFRFDFTPSRGRDAVPWTQCYPGDDTVDIIGMDSYDQPRGVSFDEQVEEPYGLQAQVDFAKSHNKPISYPEWGLFRNGDNAEYMRRMLAWIDDHKPLYNTLTDYCPHGVWQCADNPRSSWVYRSALFGSADGPATSPTPPTPSVPTAPLPPTGCSPLRPGDWGDYWFGGRLCLRLDWWLRSR